jgi:hypothetical protein
LRHDLIHFMHQRFWKIAAANAGLIRNNHDWVRRLVQAQQRAGGPREHTKTAGVIQVPDLLGDGSVAVEEDRWAQRGALKHAAP